MNVSWQGVFPAVTTQFHDDQSLDLSATLQHVERLLESGVHGLIMLGSVGENCALTPAEKLEVLRGTVEQVGGRVPVLSGVAEYTTAMGGRFAEQAAATGVDGLMVLPAMVYKADRRETVVHFRTVARATSLPIMVYNNPPSYGVDVSPAILAELTNEETLVAVKESSGDPRRITDIHNLLGDRYLIFAGVDDLVLESLLLGIDGWVSGLVNAFPEENRLLWDLALAGRWPEAQRLYRWYTPLLHLDTHAKLVQYIKLAMAQRGLGSETVRAPRLALTGEERKEILAIIHHAIKTRPQVEVQS